MKYVKDISTNTLEVKQSKFIAFLMPYSKYNETLDLLKQEHPKARHFVVAYRYLNEFNQIVEHSSDDGEPKGTSGKPTLMVLQGADIINSAVITVRYFGGTKLGTGGLVRAYSDATNLILDKAEFFEYKEEVTKTVCFDYANVGIIEYECTQNNIEIIKKDFGTNIGFTLKGTKNDLESFLDKVDRLIYPEQHYPYPT
jgi:uncharacterized YigZ family protein